MLKLGFRPDQAAEMMGSAILFEEMVEAKWVKPVVQRHKLTLYDGGALAKAWARILKGEVPPTLKRKEAKEVAK